MLALEKKHKEIESTIASMTENLSKADNLINGSSIYNSTVKSNLQAERIKIDSELKDANNKLKIIAGYISDAKKINTLDISKVMNEYNTIYKEVDNITLESDLDKYNTLLSKTETLLSSAENIKNRLDEKVTLAQPISVINNSTIYVSNIEKIIADYKKTQNSGSYGGGGGYNPPSKPEETSTDNTKDVDNNVDDTDIISNDNPLPEPSNDEPVIVMSFKMRSM